MQDSREPHMLPGKGDRRETNPRRGPSTPSCGPHYSKVSKNILMEDEPVPASALDWPRPGHAFTYKVEVVLEEYEPYDFELSVSDADEMDLSNVIYGRLGGVTTADIELRKDLYFFIGSITVASGHIEAAMKRLILTLQGNRKRKFSLVDKTWTDLHKILTNECKKTDGSIQLVKVRKELAAHLQWAERRGVKKNRDDFIHGSICDYAMPVILLSRFYRKVDGQEIIFKMHQIEEVANDLQAYARRLESLLHGIWHEAMLPESPQVPGHTAFVQREQKRN